MEKNPQKSRLEKLLENTAPITAEERINFLKEKENLDKELFNTILSQSERLGGPELLTNDGVISKANGKAYVCKEEIENTYIVDYYKLKGVGVDIYKIRIPSLAKIALEAKAVIYVLEKGQNGNESVYKITPLGMSKVDSSYVDRLRSAKKRETKKNLEGYA